MIDSRTPARRLIWRDQAWVAIVALLFVPVQVAAWIVADRIASGTGAGFPERERVAFLAAALGGLGMLMVVPATARLLGRGVHARVSLTLALLSVALAALASYAFFEDVRSGHHFETDHALPEILIPYAVLLAMSGAIGHRLAGEGPAARQSWAWLVRVTAVVTVALIGMTVMKMATTGGDFALDQPSTAVLLFCLGAYAVITVRSVR